MAAKTKEGDLSFKEVAQHMMSTIPSESERPILEAETPKQSLSSVVNSTGVDDSSKPQASRSEKQLGNHVNKPSKKNHKIKSWTDVVALITSPTATKDPVQLDVTTILRDRLIPFPAQVEEKLEVAPPRQGGIASCKLCGVSLFAGGYGEQRVHFKSHWHLVNLALNEQNMTLVSEEESQTISLEAISGKKSESSSEGDDDDDNSSFTSSSSTDDEDEDQNVMKTSVTNYHPKTFMEIEPNIQIQIHSVVCRDEQEMRQVLDATQQQSNSNNWGIILYRSGHLACAIYRQGRLVEHKTEHRYTQRRKQGGSQAAQDEKGFKARSAGAMLRRYGEQTMRERVAQVLTDWDWKTCDRIFLAVPERARRLFVYSEKKKRMDKKAEGHKFLKSDERIRRIPFMTNRPTMEECDRVYHLLQSVEVFSGPFIDNNGESSASSSSSTKNSDNTVVVADNNKTMEDPVNNNQQQESEEERLKRLGFYNRPIHELILGIDKVKPKEDEEDDEMQNKIQREIELNPDHLHAKNALGETPLHLACSLGLFDIVQMLLESGSDVTAKDVLGRVPYQRAKEAKVRDAMRAFRGQQQEQQDDHVDWKVSLIPEPPKEKSAEEIQAKKEREKEKKKRQAERKKLEKQKKEQEEKLEKERLEAERKAAELAGSCPECRKPLPAKKKDRFSQADKKFCSATCLRSHTRKLAADAAERRFTKQ